MFYNKGATSNDCEVAIYCISVVVANSRSLAKPSAIDISETHVDGVSVHDTVIDRG
jgi:hypothetical protein